MITHWCAAVATFVYFLNSYVGGALSNNNSQLLKSILHSIVEEKDNKNATARLFLLENFASQLLQHFFKNVGLCIDDESDRLLVLFQCDASSSHNDLTLCYLCFR